jgi:transcriptional regulator with XRE-family HTH domain
VTTQRRYRPRRLELRIKELMTRKGVSSVVALHALLREAGVEISHSQLTRIVNNQAELLNIAVINGLMTVLRVDADELFATRFGAPG